MNFSDRLTPGQIQQVLDNLHLPWWKYFNDDNDGWVNIPAYEHIYNFDGDLSVNIYHGGFIDQFEANQPAPDKSLPVKGDLVALIQRLEIKVSSKDAIKYIKNICGMQRGVTPPDVREGFRFTTDWIQYESKKFVRMQKEIYRSDLRPIEKLVWGAIFDRCGKGEIYSYPGIRTIANDCNLSIGSVQKSIKNLINYGLLIEKPRGVNKAPARFSLIAETETINQAIMQNQQQNEKGVHDTNTPVHSMNTRCSQYEQNYTHRTRHKELYPNATSPNMRVRTWPSSDFRDKFLLLQKQGSKDYDSLLEENDLIPLFEEHQPCKRKQRS